MKDTKLKLNTALISLLIYELCMMTFQLNGVSIFKLILTVMIWVSCTVAIYYFFVNYYSVKKKIPSLAFFILILLFSWHVICVLRSILFDNGSLATIIGNVATSLSLLVPFAIAFAFNRFSLHLVQRYFIILLKIGIVSFVFFFIFGAGSLSSWQVLILYSLLQPVIFMITILPYQKKSNKLLVAIAGLLLLYVTFFYGIRTMAIREILLLICLCGIYFLIKYKWKWVPYLAFFSILAPFFLIQQSVVTGESAIEKYLTGSTDDNLSDDTRTFLYIELFQDLVENNKLIVGKGSNGRYYSEYFSNQEGDSEVRLNIEVGILGILLKGGVIAVVLNLLILYMAIFYALFRSNNYFVLGIGFTLLVHVSLLFIENYHNYSSYNFWTWFFVGICLSEQIRKMNNSQIIQLLYLKNRK